MYDWTCKLASTNISYNYKGFVVKHITILLTLIFFQTDLVATCIKDAYMGFRVVCMCVCLYICMVCVCVCV